MEIRFRHPRTLPFCGIYSLYVTVIPCSTGHNFGSKNLKFCTETFLYALQMWCTFEQLPITGSRSNRPTKCRKIAYLGPIARYEVGNGFIRFSVPKNHGDHPPTFTNLCLFVCRLARIIKKLVTTWATTEPSRCSENSLAEVFYFINFFFQLC